MSARKIIAEHLLDYLKIKNIEVKKYGKVFMTICPRCKGEGNIIPNTYIFSCYECNKDSDIVDFAMVYEQKTNEEEILQYLKELLDINVVTEKEENNLGNLIDYLLANDFDLMNIIKNTKLPVEGEWQLKTHKDKFEVLEWLKMGQNLGFKVGAKSQKTVIDWDILSTTDKREYREIKQFKGIKCSEERKKELIQKRQKGLDIVYEKLGNIMGTPLIQESLGGEHWFYQYVSELPKTHVQLQDMRVDIENDGGYVLIEPSTLPNSSRKFKELIPIPEMPIKFKELLISKVTTLKKTYNETIRDAIESENFKIDPNKFNLKNNNLDGCCNEEFMKLTGVFRKRLSSSQVEYVMHVLNKHLLTMPMESKAITAMVRQSEKYAIFDEGDLASRVLQYLKDAEDATRQEIRMGVEEKSARVDKVVTYLKREGYIIQKGRIFKPTQKLKWQQNFTDFGKLLPYEIPFFGKFATFRNGDCIVIGAKPGTGKTHIAMNIIKRFVKQGIVVNYIPSESGGRHGVISQQIMLKEGDYSFPKKEKGKKIRPEDVELVDKSVTIIDWLLPNDYAQTDKIFERFDEQLEQHGGLLIIFVQLREDGKFYANDMMKFFPSWVCKWLYESPKDRTTAYFETEKIREGKNERTYAKIFCKFNKKTKLVFTMEELEEQNKVTEEK